MPSWIARLHTCRVVRRMRLDGVVIMGCGPVMVLRMVVIRVHVRVQGRGLASKCQGRAEQDRNETPHHPSVCNRGARVKLAGDCERSREQTAPASRARPIVTPRLNHRRRTA